MAKTSLMCLSSPEGESNYFSGLMNLTRDDGSLFFYVINCFRICKRCLKLERVKAIQCTHIKSVPHWLSARKIRDLKALYKSNPEDAIREFGGVSVSDYKPALCRDEVEDCFKQDTIITRSHPSHIFTACDPNGGGPSQMSLASGYFDIDGSLVVSRRFFSFYWGARYCLCAASKKSRTVGITLNSLMGCESVAFAAPSSHSKNASR